MKLLNKKSIINTLLLMAISPLAMGQSLPAFPSDVPVPSALEITEFVKDKTFATLRDDGQRPQFNYRSDGTFVVFFRRAKQFGTWHAENGELCVEDPINGKACNQVRISSGTLLYRRNGNGEVLTLKLE